MCFKTSSLWRSEARALVSKSDSVPCYYTILITTPAPFAAGEPEQAHADALGVAGVGAVAAVPAGRGRGPVGGRPVLPKLWYPVLQPGHVPGAQDALLQDAARGQANTVRLADGHIQQRGGRRRRQRRQPPPPPPAAATPRPTPPTLPPQQQRPVTHRADAAHVPGAAHQPRNRSSLRARPERQRAARHGRGPIATHRHRVHRAGRRHAAADRPGAGAHQVKRDPQQRRQRHDAVAPPSRTPAPQPEGRLTDAARSVLLAAAAAGEYTSWFHWFYRSAGHWRIWKTDSGRVMVKRVPSTYLRKKSSYVVKRNVIFLRATKLWVDTDKEL